jgi:limonene-1,2-epoxide hydrolase
MTNAQIMQAWFENLWSRAIESTIDELLAPDAVVHGLGAEAVVGRAQFHEFYRQFRAAFPTVRVTIERVLESGDHATAHARVEVTTQDGRGPLPFIGSCTIRVLDDQIVEGWNYFDFLTLLVHLGAVPADAMPRALAAAAAP